MSRWMRVLHKWFGLLLALQFVLWMASGLGMSLIDQDAVEGSAHRADPVAVARPWPSGLIAPVDVAARHGARSVEAGWLLDRPVYRITTADGLRVVDAATGAPTIVDAAAAATIAGADYLGEGAASPPQRMEEADGDVRGHAGPIWRVAFADADDTTLYVSATDGRILERRNRHWRLFDVLWMLHIMDYAGREDFNHPLVVVAAGAGTWIALTGLWLLVAGVRLRRRIPA
jgi:hypothetical protein